MTKRRRPTDCGPHKPDPTPVAAVVGDDAFYRAAALFRAAGDVSRLRLIEHLGRGELCVSELALALRVKMPTLSQQLKVLRTERIVRQRRDGKHIFYSLADEHVQELVRAALAHANEPHHIHPTHDQESDDE